MRRDGEVAAAPINPDMSSHSDQLKLSGFFL
jgi:hypothetical protein